MKKLIALIFVFFTTSTLYSQYNGTSIIYNSGNYGITRIKSDKPKNSGIKDFYIQLGLFNIESGVNESGKFLKLNKFTTLWYAPVNGFLNAAWGAIFRYLTYDCQPIPFFASSCLDTNLVIKFVNTPAVQCPEAYTVYTKNGGLNYSQAPFSSAGSISFPTGSDYNSFRNNTLLFGYRNLSGSNFGINRSTNAGLNWEMITTVTNLRESSGANTWSLTRFGFLKYFPYDTCFVLANGLSNLNLSTNGGYNFSLTSVKWMKDIVFSYEDSVIYGHNDFNLYRSHDKGLTWDSVQTNIKFMSLEINPDLPNILYGGDSLGVHISTNYGNNWSLFNNSFSPSKVVIGISKDAGSLDTFFVVTTQKVYKVWASFLVGITNSSNSIPEKYILYQNYPNPFNPSTTIKFSIMENGKMENGNVTLKVFDILGKEIATLVNEKLQPRTYEVPFSISQFSDKQITSGVYFYRLTTDGFSETKKMLLIK